MRFVIGHSTNVDQEQAIEAEAEQYGGFMRLPMQVSTKFAGSHDHVPNQRL